MSENFRQQAEVSVQSIDSAESSADKVWEYQKLANKALLSFYSNVDKLVTWGDWHALKQLACDRVTGMNAEIESRLAQINSWTLIAHNTEMLDSIIANNIPQLIQLWSATKESLDSLIDTWTTDFNWKYDIGKSYQLSMAINEIMKVDLKQAWNALASKASPPDWIKSTARLWNISDYVSWKLTKDKMRYAWVE